MSEAEAVQEVEDTVVNEEDVIVLPDGPVEVENAGGAAASDAVASSKGATQTPQVDVKGLSLNEKYALILAQVKQTGPVFFVQVNPNTFGLPDNDPLNLIWINMLTSWKIATTILSQFEVNVIGAQALAEEGATADVDKDTTDSTSDTEETASEPHVHIAADADENVENRDSEVENGTEDASESE